MFERARRRTPVEHLPAREGFAPQQPVVAAQGGAVLVRVAPGGVDPEIERGVDEQQTGHQHPQESGRGLSKKWRLFG